METYTSLQQHAGNRMRAGRLIEEWDDTQKPALERIKAAALAFLHSLDMARTDLLLAKDIEKVDSLACDTAGQTLDLIADLAGTARREIEDCDGDVEEMRLDLSLLKDEHAKWSVRWAARKPAPLFGDIARLVQP
jgi:hypothetical protein